jgi:hypothetical protein
MKKVMIAMVVVWLTMVVIFGYSVVRVWNHFQMSERVETFADKNFPVKK